jgi:D-alanyl-D-alanine carboxypeptidase (penicillin-binding protein 5/6)
VSDYRILQEGRMRRSERQARLRRARRRRRLRRLRRAVAVAAAALVVLLVVLSTGAQAPTGRSGHTAGSTARLSAHPLRPSRTRALAHPTYATTADSVQARPMLQGSLRSGLLFDVTTGRVLWQKDPNRVLPIASLTKLMTALVVATHSRPTDRVLITRQAIDFTGSGVGLLPVGKRVSERALLYGLLLPSGNDAAIALAQHVAGTQAGFVALMNRTARAMGLTCTHFSNVSGVLDRDNYSCARDLAILAHAVLLQPVLGPIVASPSAVLPFPIKGGKLYLSNNNPLMETGYPGIDGVKTGYTSQAGLCLVAAARRGSTWLAAVLLHSENWTAQGAALLNAGFSAVAHPGRARSRRT